MPPNLHKVLSNSIQWHQNLKYFIYIKNNYIYEFSLEGFCHLKPNQATTFVKLRDMACCSFMSLFSINDAELCFLLKGLFYCCAQVKFKSIVFRLVQEQGIFYFEKAL